jgi:hypothetical protein
MLLMEKGLGKKLSNGISSADEQDFRAKALLALAPLKV